MMNAQGAIRHFDEVLRLDPNLGVAYLTRSTKAQTTAWACGLHLCVDDLRRVQPFTLTRAHTQLLSHRTRSICADDATTSDRAQFASLSLIRLSSFA